VPDPVAIETLIDAKNRGVDVRIMVSGIRNDNWLTRHNSVRLFGRLLGAGIEIQEFTAPCCITRPWSSITVGDARYHELRQSVIRTQTKRATCASSIAPWRGNCAASFWTTSPGASVTLERWTRRGAWARAQEFVASFLQEQA
jgi:hypothetical protein